MKRTVFGYIAAAAILLLRGGSPASAQEVRKSVSILGDSYSTFENYVEPKSNELWYFVKADPERTDVTDVRQTWWHRFIRDNGYKLEKNNSYSGSTICTTGYNGADFTERAFITRMDNLGSPDILLIFGATNDSWANSPIGDFVWSDWTGEQLKSFRPALTYMLAHIVDRYPNVELLYIINDGLKPEITSSIVEACDHYGVRYLLLHDIDKTSGHPNTRGMEQIAEQVSAALK
ncbi:MAG: SGNH/GDSL hydrolase family protein [Clostridium sp.]|nr:SGNH/GDSL hydrolase family protein [Clostridium sp.]